MAFVVPHPLVESEYIRLNALVVPMYVVSGPMCNGTRILRASKTFDNLFSYLAIYFCCVILQKIFYDPKKNY